MKLTQPDGAVKSRSTNSRVRRVSSLTSGTRRLPCRAAARAAVEALRRSAQRSVRPDRAPLLRPALPVRRTAPRHHASTSPGHGRIGPIHAWVRPVGLGMGARRTPSGPTRRLAEGARHVPQVRLGGGRSPGDGGAGGQRRRGTRAAPFTSAEERGTPVPVAPGNRCPAHFPGNGDPFGKPRVPSSSAPPPDFGDRTRRLS